MIDFAGRTAFVTGGANGVGIGVVRNLIEANAARQFRRDAAQGARDLTVAVQVHSARVAAMIRPFIAAMLALGAAPLAGQQPAPEPRLTEGQRTLLHCSATFALVSGRQHAGDKDALAFPDVTQRGREYFVRALVQLMDDAGLGHDAVARLVQAEAAKLQDSPDLLKRMPACLASLDASKL